MNTTLIMNASEGRIQFVLEQEGSLACAQEWSAPSKGTELLTPALADAFQRLGIMPSDISRIACVAGPGELYRPPARADDSRRLPPGYRSRRCAAQCAPSPRGLRALRPSSFPPAKRASA